MSSNNTIKKQFNVVKCPFTRTQINAENIAKHIKDFDKSKYVFVSPAFYDNGVYMIDRKGRAMKHYIESYGAINEILSPVYNQRLFFDLDFKDNEYPEGYTINNVDRVLHLMVSLSNALDCDYRMAGYGKIPQNEVDQLVKDKGYNFIYEEKHNTHKVLSIHAVFDIITKAEQIVEIFRGDSYITDGIDKIKMDTSVYQNTNHLLRLVFSKKVQSEGITENAIKSINVKDYTKWLICVDNGDEDIKADKLEILKQWVIKIQPEPKEKPINNNIDAVIPTNLRVYNGPSIAEPIIKLPLGLIYEILLQYPLQKTGDIMFINEFHDNYKYWSALNNFIRSCPYEYDEIKNVLYRAYNINADHEHPDKLNQYAKAYIGTGKKSNQYYIELIKPFKRPVSFADYLEDNKFKIEEYEKVKDTKLNTVCKKKRDEIKAMREQRKRLLDDYLKEYGNNELYSKYKRILNIFRIFETPYIERSKFNYFFDDSKKMEFQFKKKYTDEFATCSKDKIHILDSSININKVITTSKSEYKKLLQNYTYIDDANVINGKRILEIFKAGFVNEYDYNVYMDFIRFKLLNPKKLYIKNFVCYEGKDSLKTSFINMVGEYITVGIVPVNLIHSQFNGYMNNAICVYEELPASIKESRTVIEQLKAMTSTRKISLHEKGKDSETIDNYCNIIINTNHKEVGGLFDNQTDAEMFKRFYIIKKRPIDKALINEFWDIINDNANIAACFELIKQLKPLSTDDINNTLTQEEYYSFVRNTQNNKQCLDIYEIDRTINKDNKSSCWLKSTVLIRLLKENELPASKESERQQLEKLGIIQVYPNSHFRIVDIEKYYMRYYEADTPDETDKLRQHLKKTYNINTFPDIATDSSSSSSSSSDEL